MLMLSSHRMLFNSPFAFIELPKLSVNLYVFSKTLSKEVLFNNSYFLEKTNFLEKQYSALPKFSGEPLFQSGHLFKKSNFL